MPSLAESVGKELRNILIFVGVIWATFLLSFLLPINQFGLQPRSLIGLVGIVSMPFLHAGLGHIVGNTVPLVMLLFLLAGSRAKSWQIVVEIIVLGGILLWGFGRGSSGNNAIVHIGASGLVSGLITFLIMGGVFERRFVPMVVAIITFLLYGGSLLWGFIPSDTQVSWDGHLCGAVAGGLLAFQLARTSRSKAGNGKPGVAVS